jgi:cyclic 2,3-diphosphoglycerate synthetase
MRVLALFDGEHYPAVTRWAFSAARARGSEIVAALCLGGTEKIGEEGLPDLGVTVLAPRGDMATELAKALDAIDVEAVLDLSDEPILGYRERMELVGVALAHGVSYMGPDFRFDPPVSGPRLPTPTVAVIGTGKRTGKTAIAGQLARVAAGDGLDPVIVAMGRGGPGAIQVARAGTVDVGLLLDTLARGDHAASDYLEDSLTAGVTTIGARRAGGGLAGASWVTNARGAAEAAVDLGAGVVILEGSGAGVPPTPWDAGVLVVPVGVDHEYLGGYLGPYRLLLADLIVITMASGPNAGPENLSLLRSHVSRWREDVRVAVTNFEPVPLGDVSGKAVFLATTAPDAVAADQARFLESRYGCRVVGTSARLADRAGLGRDMDRAEGYEVLLTELKAAAVDVACRKAIARGADVVFLDNRPVVAEGDADLDDMFRDTLALAASRAER